MGNGPQEEFTFEQLCEMEPELSTLYNSAKNLSNNIKRNPTIDVLDIWYDLFKPMLCNYVGWGRKNYYVYSRQYHGNDIPTFISADELLNYDPEKAKKSYKQTILDTNEGYDIAYEAISDVLLK